LANLSDDFSYPGIIVKFEHTRLESLSRKFFSTHAQQSALAVSQGGIRKDIQAMLPFFGDPAFPKSWPGTLPIVVRDLRRPPSKWKLLAADEMVAAFWKMVDFTMQGIQCLSSDTATEPPDSPNSKASQKKLELYIQQLAAARRLARNVTAEVMFVSTDEQALDLSLSYREHMVDDLMKEFIGLTGWNRIAVIGGRRDSLRQAGLPCAAMDIVKAFENVAWSSGKEVTKDTATKCLTIWDRLWNLPDAMKVVLSAQASYGRGSPYEDWSKLYMIMGACQSNAELVWVMQTILAELAHGKHTDISWSTLYTMRLRKTLIDGILATFFQTSLETLEALVKNCPDLMSEFMALKECWMAFGSVTQYYKRGRAQQPCQPVGYYEKCLPKWAAGVARRVMRACHDGHQDGVLLRLVAFPPKRGGFSAVKYEDIIAIDRNLQDDIEEIRKAHCAWLAEREGRTTIIAVAGPHGSAKTDDKKGGDAKADQAVDTDAVFNQRQELAAVAKETRCAHASLMVMPQSALACANAVMSTAAWEKASAEVPTQERVCFLYSVGMSWDPRRVDRTDPKKRHSTAGLWWEDFQLFMDTMHLLVTPESQNYIVVFPGSANRHGSGVAVDAGLFVENQVLDMVSQSCKSWRAKRAVVVYKAASVDRRFRGVHGGVQDRGMQIQTITTTTRIQHFPLRLSAMLLPCFCRALAMLLPCCSLPCYCLVRFRFSPVLLPG
jgi:hypothetical protein